MRININLSQNYSTTHPVGKPVAVLGNTEFGEICKPTIISSSDEFFEKFGYMPAAVDTFSDSCLDILNGGSKLLVSRVGARLNPLDDTSQQGTFSVIKDHSRIETFEVTGTIQNTAGYNGFLLRITPGYQISINIDGSTLKGQKICTFDVVSNEYSYYTISKVLVQSVSYCYVEVEETAPSAVTGGAPIAYLNNTFYPSSPSICVFVSKTQGEVYQDFVMTAEVVDTNIPPVPNYNGKQNITITLPTLIKADGTPVSKTFYNYPIGLFTQVDIDRFNDECDWFSIDASLGFNGQFVFSPLTKIHNSGTFLSDSLTQFTNGISYTTNISSTDYIGAATVRYGIHSFDDFDDFYRIAQLTHIDALVDKYLENYCEARKFCRVILPIPKVSGAEATDYRLGNLKPNTIYHHIPCNTFYSTYIYGYYKVKGVYVPVVPLAIIARTIKDAAGLHYSPSDTNIVPVWNSLDIHTNIYGTTPAAEALMETVRLSGICPFVDIRNNQRFYGGKTNLIDINTPFSNESVVDCVMFLRNSLAAELPLFLFNPQDVTTWKRIIQRVKDILLNELNDSLISTTEGIGYIITGDQYVADITKAVYNTQADIALGLYKFKLQVKFKGTIEFITFNFTVNATNVSF